MRMRIRRPRMMRKVRGDDDNSEDTYGSNDKYVGQGRGQ